jgi:hypothetical protein
MLWETFIQKALNLSSSQYCDVFPHPILIFSATINENTGGLSKFVDTPERSALPTRLDLANKNRLGFFPKSVLFLETNKSQYIGREAKSCEMVLPFSEISRQHARITWQEKIGWILKDHCSRNGTYFNEKKCASGQPYVLHNNDVIRFATQVTAIVRNPIGICQELELIES